MARGGNRWGMLMLALGLWAALPAQAQTGPVRVDLYGGYDETVGSGIALSDWRASEWAMVIDFGHAAEGLNDWWPLGQYNSFGARITVDVDAATSRDYALLLGSDDAAYLFIDGQLVLSRPGPNSYGQTGADVAIAAGRHRLEIQFYNSFCCGGSLTLDTDGLELLVSPVPEPAAWALWSGGLLAAGAWMRRRRQPR